MDLFTLLIVVAIFGGLGFLIVKIVQAIVEAIKDKIRESKIKANKAREAEQKQAEKAHRSIYGPFKFTLEYSYNDTLEKVDIENGGQKFLNNSPEDKLFFETINKATPSIYSLFLNVKMGKYPNVRLAIQCNKTVIIITNKAVYRYNDVVNIDETYDYIENIYKYRHRASGYIQPIQYAQKLLNGIYKDDYCTCISEDVFGDSVLTIYETYLAPSLRSKVNPTDIRAILSVALAT